MRNFSPAIASFVADAIPFSRFSLRTGHSIEVSSCGDGVKFQLLGEYSQPLLEWGKSYLVPVMPRAEIRDLSRSDKLAISLVLRSIGYLEDWEAVNWPDMARSVAYLLGVTDSVRVSVKEVTN